MNLTIRYKLFLTIMAVVVVFVAIVNYFVFGLLDDVIEHHIEETIDSSASAYEQFEVGRRDLFQLRADAMSQVAHLKATLAIPEVDAETVAYAGRTLRDIADLSLIVVLNDRGQILTDVNQVGVNHGTVLDLPGIDIVRQGYTHYDTWKLGSATYRVAAAPVVSGEELVGIVVVGEEIGTPQDMGVVLSLASTEIAIVIQDEVVYPTASSPSMQAVKALITADRLTFDPAPASYVDKPNRQYSTEQGVYYARSLPLGPSAIGEIIFYVSRDVVAASLASVRLWVMLASGLSLLLALWVSWGLANKISKPLGVLNSAAQAFGRGEGFTEVLITSTDEVGTLAQSFNSMTRDVTRNREALVESKDAAEAASRAKSAFLATMSHEIRTPLNGVIGTANLLRQTGLTPTQSRYCSTITSSSKTLLGILNSILDFSKIEAGHLELETTSTNLSDLVDEAFHLFDELAQEKGLNLVADIGCLNQLWVKTDALRLRQVLNNLLSNAIKFTDTGDVRVSLETLVSEAEFSVVRFLVSDTGIGIDEKALANVFDLFVQADDTMSRRFGGYRLGSVN